MPDLGLEVLWKGKNFARLLGGLWVALRISLIAAGISIVLGILLGIAASRKHSAASVILRVWLGIIHIMPQMVLLFLMFFGTTRAFGWNMSGELVAVHVENGEVAKGVGVVRCADLRKLEMQVVSERAFKRRLLVHVVNGFRIAHDEDLRDGRRRLEVVLNILQRGDAFAHDRTREEHPQHQIIRTERELEAGFAVGILPFAHFARFARSELAARQFVVVEQRRQIQRRAAAEDDVSAPRGDVEHRLGRVAAETREIVDLRRGIGDVDEVVFHLSVFVEVLAGADVHVPVDLTRVDADDLRVETSRQRDGERGLAGGGGAGHGDDFQFFVHKICGFGCKDDIASIILCPVKCNLSNQNT